MFKQGKKGFTLIELISVILILGIIATIAIGGYSKYLKKVKREHYHTQEEMMIESGKDFFTDNKGRLPLTSGSESCVLLKTLITNKYIDPILDYNKKSCNDTNSKVCATKIEKDKYIYTSYLDCNNQYQSIEYKAPRITFNLSKDETFTAPKNNSYTIEMTINYKNTISLEERSGIASYRYIIYKKDATDFVYYDTVWKNYKDQTKVTRKHNIKLDTSGTYYIKGYAYNTKGKLAEATSGTVTLNFDLDCSKDITFINNDYNFEWTNSNIATTIKKSGGVYEYSISLITMPLNNSTISKKTLKEKTNKYEYQSTINKEGFHQYEVTAYDITGKSCTAISKKYKIDKTAPSCEVTGSNDINHWTKQDLTLTAKCIENSGSGCKQDKVTKKITQDMSSDNVNIPNVVDNVGNEAKCIGSAYVDKTAPTLTVTEKRCTNVEDDGTSCDQAITKTTKTNDTISLENWSSKGAHIKYQVNDNNGSGVEKIVWNWNKAGTYGTAATPNVLSTNKDEFTVLQRVVTLTAGGKRKGQITAYDKVGNKSTVIVTSFISKTYTLTYSSNGGSACSKKTITYNNSTPTSWGTLCTPTRTGYTFVGWYLNSNFSGSKFTNTTNLKQNNTVYAKWKPKTINVTFNANYGTNPATKQQTFTYDVTNQQFNQTFTRSGYKLLGWSFQKNATSKTYSVNSAVINSWIDDHSPSTTLYAVWKPKTINVTFNANYGTNPAIKQQTFTYDVTNQKFNKTFTRSGYKLLGWSFQKNATSKTYSVNSAVNNSWIDKHSPSKTLYAVWQKTEKTYNDVTPKYIKYRYATLGNGSNGSSVLYNEAMNKTKNEYNNCYNCGTNSWKNTNFEYVTMKVSLEKVSNDNKKIKISVDLKNNVGTYLMASDNNDYIRKVCFTTGRTYKNSTCYGKSVTIKNKNQDWTNGTVASAELDIPQEAGEYAIKIYSPNCHTDCNPYASGSCNEYMCSGIAVFQTNYVIKVN